MQKKMAALIGVLILPFATPVFAGKNHVLIREARNGNLAGVQLLVSEGADVNAYTSDGITPIDAAAMSGYLGVVKYLVEHNANLEPDKPFDNTPLAFAASYGHLDIVRYLLQNGADPTYKNNLNQSAGDVICRDAAFKSFCPKDKIIQVIKRVQDKIMEARAKAEKDRLQAIKRVQDKIMEAKAKAEKDRARIQAEENRYRNNEIVWAPDSDWKTLFPSLDEVSLSPDVLSPNKPTWDNFSFGVTQSLKNLRTQSAGVMPKPPQKPPTLTQGKFESRASFNQRVIDAADNYKNQVSQYNQEVRAYNQRVKKYRISKIARGKLFEGVFLAVFKSPVISHVEYNPDTQIFSLKVISDSPYAQGFNQDFSLTTPIPNDRAQEFEKNLKQADPFILFKKNNSSIHIVKAVFIVKNKNYPATPGNGNNQVQLASIDLGSQNSINLVKPMTPPTINQQYAQGKAGYHSSVDHPSFPRNLVRPNDFAVIIGVQDYQSQNIPEAQFARRDAKAVKRYIERLGVPNKHIKLLLDADATKGRIEGYIKSWLPKNVSPDSRVYFYYSGHGSPDENSDSAYLLPWDGEAEFLGNTALSLKSVYSDLGELTSKHVLVALDSCFSGVGPRSTFRRGSRPLVNRVRGLNHVPKNITLLAAAKSNQTAQSDEDEGHGLFSYYFLKGLDNKNWNSNQLCKYLKPEVKKAAALENATQDPVCLGQDFKF